MNELLSLITDVDILINGKPVKKYSHQGKVFVEAREGSEYAIRVKNGLWNRMLSIVSVDGINVLDGKAAGASKAGYVLNGWNSYEIKGFRTSNDEVNAFKFAKKDKSYAAKSDETHGDTSNCGVIGVQFYCEKPAEVVYTWATSNNPVRYGTSTSNGSETLFFNATAGSIGAEGPTGPMGLAGQSDSDYTLKRSINYCSSISEPITDYMDFDLGTEFSKNKIEDKVRDVEFEIGAIYSTFEIYYASREALLAMGVPLQKVTQIAFPKAFPSKFCKPPRD